MGDIFVFIFFGLVGVMGCYFLYSQSLSNYIVLPAITIGLLSTAVLNLNNMRDREQDEKVHKRTLAVELGGVRVKTYHTFLILGGFVSAAAYIVVQYHSLLDLIPLIAFIPLFLNIVKVYKTETPALLDPELKKVALSTFLFSLLLLVTATMH